MRTVLVGLLVATSFIATAEATTAKQKEKSNKYGYSYFSIGTQKVDYEEKQNSEIELAGGMLPYSIRTEGSVSSMTLRSGGLFKAFQELDFSIDATATFSPRYGDESWFIDTNIPGVHVGEKEVQNNSLSFTDATTRLLLQYKWNDSLRGVFGGAFQLHQFKRNEFNFISPLTITEEYETDCIELEGQGSCVLISQSEENISNINLIAGLAYETTGAGLAQLHHSAKVLIGSTVWSHVTNSNNPELEFEDTGALTFLASLRSTYKISDNVNIGFFAEYEVTKRDEETLGPFNYTQNEKSISKLVSIPKATTSSLSIGITSAWSM